MKFVSVWTSFLTEARPIRESSSFADSFAFDCLSFLGSFSTGTEGNFVVIVTGSAMFSASVLLFPNAF